MKKTNKKLIGCLIIATILATIGVTAIGAQTEDNMFWGRLGFIPELTEEQREDLKTTIQQKFEEYGIEMPTRDEILEKQIERTEQRLDILKRQKELREEGYEWEDIQETIQIEFEIEFPEDGHCMRFGYGRCRGFLGFFANEDSEI